MLDFEIVKQCLVIVLCCETGILQVAICMFPVLYATIVIKAQVFGNSKV